jgi:hypothetical protein
LFGETKRLLIVVCMEIVMVRLQGAVQLQELFRCALLCASPSTICVVTCTDVEFRAQMVREEGPSSLARGVGPNVFRTILMNASQLASCVLPFSLSLSLSFVLSLHLSLVYPFSPLVYSILILGLLQIQLLQRRAAQDEVL